MNIKKALCFGISSILLIGIMSGCTKKVDYSGSSFDDLIKIQMDEREDLSNKLNKGKLGVFEEDEEMKQQPLEEVIEKQEKEGTRRIPENLDVNLLAGNECSPYSLLETEENVEFLNNEYVYNKYSGDLPLTGAWIYTTEFKGESDEIYKDYSKYLSKIEKEYKPGYAESYNTIYKTIEDMKNYPYIQMYNLNENLFLCSIGIYDETTQSVKHSLGFINRKSSHYIEGEYGWLLAPLDNLIKTGKASSDFVVNIIYDGINNSKVSSDEIIMTDEEKDSFLTKFGY